MNDIELSLSENELNGNANSAVVSAHAEPTLGAQPQQAIIDIIAPTTIDAQATTYAESAPQVQNIQNKVLVMNNYDPRQLDTVINLKASISTQFSTLVSELRNKFNSDAQNVRQLRDVIMHIQHQ